MHFDTGAIAHTLLSSGALGEAFTDVTAGIGDVRRLVPDEEVPPDDDLEEQDEKPEGDADEEDEKAGDENAEKNKACSATIDHY